MIGVQSAFVLLSAAVLLGLVQVVRATDGASRAIVGDLVFFAAIAMLSIVGILTDNEAVPDAALLGSIVGILATISLARILTRGRR